jgi:excinuclease ABC subunit C
MSTSKFDHKSFLETLTQKPGVYRMIDAEARILYVGKARNLKNRVTSYFRASGLQTKTIAMVSKITDIQVTATSSETEALLLEQSLIKSEKPPYNILLRDDKSYPYIFLSSDNEFPRLSLHRGKKKKKGEFFGPYPSAYAVRESIQILQKLFKIRQCNDTYFKNRSRPCLQYQIKRCSGPCTGLIDKDTYEADIRMARLFLAGKSRQVLDEFKQAMKEASETLNYEVAAEYRDQILHLRRIQEEQFVLHESGDVDVFGLAEQVGSVCVQVIYIRKGKMLGQRTYYPKDDLELAPEQVMEAFLSQYYFGGSTMEVPSTVLVSHAVNEKVMLERALTDKAQKKVQLLSKVRSKRAEWVRMAVENAELNLNSYQVNKENVYSRFENLQIALKLKEMPERMECFDVSHTMGEATVASCVVFDQGGPLKTDYRRFNIEGVAPGDDYAATEQALRRRYSRLKKEEAILPELLIIDGGLGQISRANKVLSDLELPQIKVLGIAKGPDRKAGLEKFYWSGLEVSFHSYSSASQLLQHIRDEAHRFAIAGHRSRRARARSVSELESIEGIGPKRRRQLLTHFGGIAGVKGASEQEIAKVQGISHAIARDIYQTLHG